MPTPDAIPQPNFGTSTLWPTQVAFQQLDEPHQKAFAQDLIDLWSGANTV